MTGSPKQDSVLARLFALYFVKCILKYLATEIDKMMVVLSTCQAFSKSVYSKCIFKFKEK